jgi:hypothetical protein
LGIFRKGQAGVHPAFRKGLKRCTLPEHILRRNHFANRLGAMVNDLNREYLKTGVLENLARPQRKEQHAPAAEPPILKSRRD